MSIRVQWRRGTAAQWTSANPTLAAGEAGFETDTGKFKVGDGSTVWTGLEYKAGAADVAAVRSDLASTDSGKGAELVGFIQSGTGAVARTMQDKARDQVSIKDFGAVGDGSTDDRAALNNASAITGEKYVPAGTYAIASNLTLSGGWAFARGAKLKPANGVTITLASNSSINSAGDYRDTSAGGLFSAASGTASVSMWPLPVGAGASGPNFLAGYAGNAIAADVGSATISGGGSTGRENVIGGTDISTVDTANKNVTGTGSGADYSVITGGYDNMACGLASIISGFHNYTAPGTTHGTICGGSGQKIDVGDYCTIGGGAGNSINAGNNGVSEGSQCTIGGGGDNAITGTTSPLTGTTIAGGKSNTASGNIATIGGGQSNTASGTESTIAGGKSNAASASYATVSGGDANVASAAGATIGGGRNQAASGQYSTIPGGINNTASGNYSVAIGTQAVASLYGATAQSAGQFTASGDAQVVRAVLRRQTTNATPTELRLDGNTARMVLPDNTTWLFTIRVVGRSTNTDANAAYELKGCIARGSGAATTALVGSLAATVLAESSAAWDATAAALASTIGALTVTVTGEAAVNINWVASVELVQVCG